MVTLIITLKLKRAVFKVQLSFFVKNVVSWLIETYRVVLKKLQDTEGNVTLQELGEYIIKKYERN